MKDGEGVCNDLAVPTFRNMHGGSLLVQTEWMFTEAEPALVNVHC